MKPIVFLASGTRGDVQPIAALARGFQDAGHNIRVAAPPAFRELVESQSIPFAELEGNPSDLLTTPGRQSTLTFNEHPLRNAGNVLRFMRAARPLYSRMIANAWQLSRDASILIIGLPTIWTASIAEALGIPCIGTFLQPLTPTADFPSPLWPSSLQWGSAYNRLTHSLSNLALFLPWRKVINTWRRQMLGLANLPLHHNLVRELDAVLYGFSDKVVPAPRDWKGLNFITGYWMQKAEDFNPPQDLQSFLNSGGPPFYFGFGSPGMHDPRSLIESISRAVINSKIRAVISLPREYSSLAWKSPDIHVLKEDIPHSWLFPQMAGIVHHGGAGTTATVLMAGVPTLITPLATDQYFWGERVRALGTGPRPIPQRSLTSDNLVKALNHMQDDRMRDSARRFGEKLQGEQGIPQAVQTLESLLPAGSF